MQPLGAVAKAQFQPAGAAYGLFRWVIVKKNSVAIVVALAVISHWVFDLVVHTPDLPLFPSSQQVKHASLKRLRDDHDMRKNQSCGSVLTTGRLFAAAVRFLGSYSLSVCASLLTVDSCKHSPCPA